MDALFFMIFCVKIPVKNWDLLLLLRIEFY
jgi:hypothetical protein